MGRPTEALCKVDWRGLTGVTTIMAQLEVQSVARDMVTSGIWNLGCPSCRCAKVQLRSSMVTINTQCGIAENVFENAKNFHHFIIFSFQVTALRIKVDTNGFCTINENFTFCL
jgi:hypothetical protein